MVTNDNIFVTSPETALFTAFRYKYKENRPMSNMSIWQMV